MNSSANNALNLPHNSSPGTRKNSRAFIVATNTICNQEFSRGLIPLITHIAIPVSPAPIKTVKRWACAGPMMAATIC